MIKELLGKEVSIVRTYIGSPYAVKGEIVEVQPSWLKLMQKNKKEKKLIYISMNQIVHVAPL